MDSPPAFLRPHGPAAARHASPAPTAAFHALPNPATTYHAVANPAAACPADTTRTATTNSTTAGTRKRPTTLLILRIPAGMPERNPLRVPPRDCGPGRPRFDLAGGTRKKGRLRAAPTSNPTTSTQEAETSGDQTCGRLHVLRYRGQSVRSRRQMPVRTPRHAQMAGGYVLVPRNQWKVTAGKIVTKRQNCNKIVDFIVCTKLYKNCYILIFW